MKPSVSAPLLDLMDTERDKIIASAAHWMLDRMNGGRRMAPEEATQLTALVYSAFRQALFENSSDVAPLMLDALRAAGPLGQGCQAVCFGIIAVKRTLKAELEAGHAELLREAYEALDAACELCLVEAMQSHHDEERKQAKQALSISEEKYRAVVEQSVDCIFLVDIETRRVIEANRALQALLGYSRDELLTLTLYDFVAHDQADVDQKVERCLQQQQHFLGERRYRRRGGGSVDMEVSVNVIEYSDRRVFCVVSRDITERKQAERERLQMQAQLQRAQKLEAIGTLAGGVAHDINNVITTIGGFADLAMMGMSEDHPVRSDLEQIKANSRRATDLTRQLLLFSRREQIDPHPIALNRTIENLVKMIRRIIGEDITVLAELDPNLRPVRGDEGSIEQVIMNLAVNARDAMPEGGTLTIKADNVLVDATAAQRIPEAKEGCHVCLYVADTGVGMDEDSVKQIFEPFFTTKPAGRGTGLGLAVAYGIVTQHQGWLEVESQPGQGTRFLVYFPAISHGELPMADRLDDAEPRGGQGEVVLVVEDEPGVRSYACRVLRESGYRVLEAASAIEAFSLFQKMQREVAVVFTDVVLPDRSGLRLVEDALAVAPETPVVLCSGYTDERSRLATIREQGYRFLAKPYGPIDLLQAIKDALKRKR